MNGKAERAFAPGTASGFSGSPTLATNRSEPRSCSSFGLPPKRISIRMAVGAVYHTVIFLLFEDLVPPPRIELALSRRRWQSLP